MLSNICLCVLAVMLVVFFILFLKRIPTNLKGYYGNPLLILVVVSISLIAITLCASYLL